MINYEIGDPVCFEATGRLVEQGVSGRVTKIMTEENGTQWVTALFENGKEYSISKTKEQFAFDADVFDLDVCELRKDKNKLAQALKTKNA